ncbi:MAG TPA: hypothetical protein GXX62_04775 [Alcaligenaceae bacterium]|nr:hypothetical protein [Alcaligenaceae bacterium]
MNDISIEELKKVLIESIKKKEEEKVYKHPLLQYANAIEALVKSGARHRDVIEYFNNLASTNYNNKQLYNLLYRWRTSNIINKIEVDKIKNDIALTKVKDKSMAKMMDFVKAIYNINQTTIKDMNDAKLFFSNNYNDNVAIKDLAQRYINKQNGESNE